ncbi:mediator of DNA damage checkpoint protein 1-like, partial [Lagopus leucura]|uniref:mediator of DNA damage checkpoint protein 1-like n=1 Tax=Lagopus leucura TaxID=30410 RepID=UPI001C67396D
GSDTDVEELNPDVPPPENPKTPQIAPQDPAVVTETPNPDVVALNGDSDTDVEDLGGVEAPQTHEATQGFINSDAVAASAPDAAPDAAPDVALAAPNPAVPPAVSPGGGSDTDGEEVAPTPHIRSLRSRIRPRNPNVGSRATSGGADVGQMNPKCGKSTPERQSLAPEACGAGGVGGAAPQRHNSAPQTDTESPKGSDGAQTPSRDASTTGSEAAAAPAPKSPDPAPNLGLAGAGQHHPNGDTDVTEGDTEAEDDPDLFLASTQNFLPPTQNFLPPPPQGGCPPDPTPAWDPEEPTQCFYHPEEEEEKEEEEPPQRRVASRVPTVTPAQDDLGTFTAPSKDVGEGPRRSQRQTRSRGGGASREGGGAKAAGGGATTDPTPLRRSPRLLARPIPAEQKRGRGQDEPRPPPPAPRPRRGGHAPSQKKAREEEEPADITRPQLRPRGSSASSCPKVLFTGVVASPEMEAALGALGGSMAASVFDCTHLVTDRVRRTVKFLCAVARGIAIVTPTWLHQSARSGRVLPPGPFLVQDSQQEQHFGFSLSQALSRARRRPLLQVTVPKCPQGATRAPV